MREQTEILTWIAIWENYTTIWQLLLIIDTLYFGIIAADKDTHLLVRMQSKKTTDNTDILFIRKEEPSIVESRIVATTDMHTQIQAHTLTYLHGYFLLNIFMEGK